MGILGTKKSRSGGGGGHGSGGECRPGASANHRGSAAASIQDTLHRGLGDEPAVAERDRFEVAVLNSIVDRFPIHREEPGELTRGIVALDHRAILHVNHPRKNAGPKRNAASRLH